jgi:hypothetical protein
MWPPCRTDSPNGGRVLKKPASRKKVEVQAKVEIKRV